MNESTSTVRDPIRAARETRLGVLIAACVVLWSCGGLFGGKSDQQPIQTYMFSPRSFQQIGEVDSDLVMLVSPVKGIGLDSLQMAYSMRPFERTYYAFNQWTDTPPRMIEPLVIQAMEASGIFRAVIEASSASPADVRLNVDVLILQHEFHTERSQGRIVMRAQLNDMRRNRIVGTRLFEATSPAATENAYGGVLALNLALESLLGELTRWVAELVEEFQ